MATTEQQLDPQMTIEEILSKFPQKSQKIAQALTSAGLHCVGCGAAVWETLEAGMLSHGKTPEEVESLIKKLNAILAEEVDLETVTVTDRAAEKYLQILEEEGKVGWGIRFSEKAGGCGGFEYLLDYSEKPLEDDAIFTTEQGLEVHIKQTHVKRLLGSVIDYIDGLHGSGFKVTNPNVRSACGCGSSHNYS